MTATDHKCRECPAILTFPSPMASLAMNRENLHSPGWGGDPGLALLRVL